MSSIKELAKQTYEIVILGFPLSEGSIDVELDSVKGEAFRGCLLSFRSSLEDALQLATTPFQMASEMETSLAAQRFHAAERIRNLQLVSSSEEITEEMEVSASDRASEKLSSYLQSGKEDGGEFISSVMRRIKSEATSPSWRRLERNLRLQSLVIAWGAFEVCAKESLTHLINRNPKTLELLTSGKLKRKIDVQALSLQELSRYDYNVRNCLGDIVLGHLDFSNYAFLKSMLEEIFPNSSDLLSHYKDDRLYSLACRRHLIVHRRGIVDEKYVKETSTSLKVGDDLKISSKSFEECLKHLWVVARLLVAEASNVAEAAVPQRIGEGHE